MSSKTVFQGRIIRVEVGQVQFPHGHGCDRPGILMPPTVAAC